MSDIPTPLTDAVIRRLTATSTGGACDAVVLHFARDLERKLAMCRVALDDAEYAIRLRRNTGLPTYDGIASATEKRIRETLEATEPTP